MISENELAKIAVDISFKIHTTLGPGLLESIYEAAFAVELKKSNIRFERQKEVHAFYDGQDLGLGFRADFIIDNKLLIELKSVELLNKVHHKTTLTYLKLTNLKLGLLINFNVELIKDGIHRKINGQLA